MTLNPILKEIYDVRENPCRVCGGYVCLPARRTEAAPRVRSSHRQHQATNHPMHRSGEAGRFTCGKSIAAAR